MNIPTLPEKSELKIPPIKIPFSKKEYTYEELTNIYENWKFIRDLYPGWLFLPQENAEILWRETNTYSWIIFNNLEILNFEEKLKVLFELNWRIDRCSIPYSIKQIEVLVNVLMSINPFPQIIDIEDATCKPNMSEYENFDWNILNSYWIELVIAVIEDARRDIDEKTFNYWMNIFDKIKDLNTEYSSKYYYEKCLFYLSSYRLGELRKHLDIWNKHTETPIFKARRASIFAEIGELEIAEKLSLEALSEIREQKKYINHIKLLSQEGWIMLLIQCIQNNYLDYNNKLSEEFSDRWETLNLYRCNPWTEINKYIAILKNTKLSNANRTEITQTFDPDTHNIAHTSNYDMFSETMPAFAFLMMYEKTCLPMKCGIVSIFQNTIFNASDLIKYSLPYWSISNVLRSEYNKELDKYLSRIRIITLDDTQFERIFNTYIDSLEQFIDSIINGSQGSKSTTRVNSLIVKNLSEFLSRFSIRLNNLQTQRLLDLTFKMYRYIKLNIYDYQDSVKVLLKRILFGLNNELFVKNLNTLLDLPMANENDFEIIKHSNWTDPFSYINNVEDYNVAENICNNNFKSRLDQLIKYCYSDDINLRSTAVLRLSVLNRLGILNKDENFAFSTALWSKIDNTTKLPCLDNFLDNFLITLPNNNYEELHYLIKQKYLNRDFPRIINRVYSEDKKKIVQRSGGGYSHSYNYLIDLRYLTKPLFQIDRKYSITPITWSENEAVVLLQKLVSWWDEEKEDVLEKEELGLFSLYRDVKKAFDIVNLILTRVIIPFLGSKYNEVQNEIQRLVREMEDKGYNMAPTLTLLLIFNPENENEVNKAILDGINSTNENDISFSLDAIFLWLVYSSRNQIVTPSIDLKDLILQRLISRRQPGLSILLEITNDIIKYVPEIFSTEELNLLNLALSYLLKDTEIPPIEQLINNKEYYFFSLEEIPHYRELCSKLAFNLYNFLISKEIPIPSIILSWKKSAEIDPLPEVRNIWL